MSYSKAASAAGDKKNDSQSDVISEMGTVIDESEISSYHGFDSDSLVCILFPN